MKFNFHRFSTTDIAQIKVNDDVPTFLKDRDEKVLSLNGEQGYIVGIEYVCIPVEQEGVLTLTEQDLFKFNPYQPSFFRFSEKTGDAHYSVSIHDFENNIFKVIKEFKVNGDFRNKKTEEFLVRLRKEYYVVNIPYFEYPLDSDSYQDGINQYLISSDYLTKVGSILTGQKIMPVTSYEEKVAINEQRELRRKNATLRFNKFIQEKSPLEQ